MTPAIIPAAGKGTRMGGPKLTLPVSGTPLITRVISALREGGASPVFVVVGPRSGPGAEAVIDEATRAGADVVEADHDPADMRASVVLGLEHLQARGWNLEGWLLTPGDLPGLTAEAVARVIRRGREAAFGSIVIPTRHGKRGHPVYFPGEIVAEIRSLSVGQGINTVVARRADGVIELDLGDVAVDLDLDTPEDLASWTQREEK